MSSFYTNELVQFRKRDDSNNLNNYAVRSVKVNDSIAASNYKSAVRNDKVDDSIRISRSSLRQMDKRSAKDVMESLKNERNERNTINQINKINQNYEEN